MKQFLGYIIKKAVGKGKVSPTIKSVKPNLKKTVKETKRDLETKNFLKIDKLRKQKSEGMKAARKAQRELQRAAETKRATKIGRSYFGRSVPARSSDLANPTEVKTKKFKTGKELERDKTKKMGGGMIGRRMGYSQGKLAVTPREKRLAAQYGDKKRITRGDVITAAKKKSGERMQASVGGGAGQTRKEKILFKLNKNIKNVKEKMKGPTLTKSQEDKLRDIMKKKKFAPKAFEKKVKLPVPSKRKP